MRRVIALRLIGLVLISGAASLALAQQKSISAGSGWVKMPSGGDATAAFVTIDNPTMYDAYLVSASSDVAASLTFRQRANGQAAKEVADLVIPAYSSLEMSPDGPHLWLSGLKRPLTERETVTLQLTTDGHLTLSVTAEVRR
jgi:copper(I)-binding protein